MQWKHPTFDQNRHHVVVYLFHYVLVPSLLWINSDNLPTTPHPSHPRQRPRRHRPTTVHSTPVRYWNLPTMTRYRLSVMDRIPVIASVVVSDVSSKKVCFSSVLMVLSSSWKHLHFWKKGRQTPEVSRNTVMTLTSPSFLQHSWTCSFASMLCSQLSL